MQCPKCQTPAMAGSSFCDSCGASLSVQSDPMVGRTLLNQYVITKKLGEGGFGAVYEADQPSMGRKVAIKPRSICLRRPNNPSQQGSARPS